jgi:hypothetical protein
MAAAAILAIMIRWGAGKANAGHSALGEQGNGSGDEQGEEKCSAHARETTTRRNSYKPE